MLAVFVASISAIRPRNGSISGYVADRACASVNSGNQPRTSTSHSPRESRGPPGASPAPSAGLTYLRTVFTDTFKLSATTAFGRPACQCCKISTTSITSNALLAIQTSLVSKDQVEARVHQTRSPVGGPAPRVAVGNYLNAD